MHRRAKDPDTPRGLIWHTQGSGKTYTMLTLAKRLVEDPVFENPTVLMLVDRNELEIATVPQPGGGGGRLRRGRHQAQLQRLLRG